MTGKVLSFEESGYCREQWNCKACSNEGRVRLADKLLVTLYSVVGICNEHAKEVIDASSL